MTDFSKLKVVLPQAFTIENLDVKVLLDIDLSNIEETMQYQPMLYATVGMYARAAEKQLADLKAELDLLESRIRRDLDFQFSIDKKRLVKDNVRQVCNDSPVYVQLQASVRQAEYAASVLATLEESFKQRYGMVQQIAKRRSNELTQLGQVP